MPTDVELSRAVDSVRRLEGVNGGVSQLSPRLVNGRSVPAVQGLTVTSAVQSVSTTLVTLTWQEPTLPTIVGYRVWAVNALKKNAAPLFLGQFQHSPAQVLVTSDVPTTCILRVQTVLDNGLTNPLTECPTVSVPVVTEITLPDGSVTNAKIVSVDAVKITGQLSAGQIATAAIDATKFNIKQIIVVSLTLTDNSPGAGRVAWSACTVYYNGLSYSIAGGNTSTTNKFITWAIAAGTFTAADSYMPTAGVFLIATNTSGTADTAWNKQGTALGAVQETNLAFNILKAASIQPAATYSFVFSGSDQSNTVLTVSQASVLYSVTVRIDTAMNSNTLVVGDELYVTLQIDGGSPQTISVLRTTGALGATVPFAFGALTFTDAVKGDGKTAGDFIVMRFDSLAASSLVVTAYLKSNTLSMAAGDATIGVGYGLIL